MTGLTQSYLKQRLSYDPILGLFSWLPRPVHHFADKTWNNRFAGKLAGCISSDGYTQIRLDGKSYRAARLAWLYMNGTWPDGQVDHIDGCTTNDVWSNLRLASITTNSWNRKLNVNNKSGYPGVSRTNPNCRWKAVIRRKGVHYDLGLFDTFEEAKAARMVAEIAHGGRTRKGL